MGQVIMHYGRTRREEGEASGAVGTTNITNVNASASAASGSTPTVSATLSDTSLSFAFGLVPGATGPQGETGPQGATGNGISGISLISTVGKVKTYRITFTDGSTYDYTVTDGADGSGAGDMTKAVYDTDDDGFVDAVEDTLNPGTGIEFSLDSAGKGQYRAAGASTWIPFLSGPTYTRLWTNSNPSASFAAQTVNLSAAASGFDMLRIVWARINTAGVTANNWESSTDALSCLYDMTHATSLMDATNRLCMDCAVRPVTGYYARRCWFTSTACTAIEFGTTTRWGASGTNNALCVPICIDGVTF